MLRNAGIHHVKIYSTSDQALLFWGLANAEMWCGIIHIIDIAENHVHGDGARCVMNLVVIAQRQLDSLSMFIRLRSTGHRSGFPSDTSVPPAAALEERACADNSVDQRGGRAASGLEAPVSTRHDATARHDAAQ